MAQDFSPDYFNSTTPVGYDGTNWTMDSFAGNGTNSTKTSQMLDGASILSPIFMSLAGLIGNILALLILHRQRVESQRLMFHSLVAVLVWNDILGIVLTTPVTIASYINNNEMPGGHHLCNFNGFIMISFGLSTPLIVCAMAIERFLFVKYTFFYTKHCAPGSARVVTLCIWGFVLFFGLLPMFGFGEYTLQYPNTWCFLNFREAVAVKAAYGYLYSILNLLIQLIMVVCNLVVVVTLVRVRDYRRKHSTCSTNTVMSADCVMDDSVRLQAMAKRRKQKDIELQMIVVMFAITMIFAVCYAPLMIYIVTTLAAGRSSGVFGLVAIRMASLNQTLNPWLYVILRRTLIIKVKKFCCRWRRCLKKRPTMSPVPVGRRHQYVHVRNQLCHRSNFVGGGINESLSDSMRKSIQQAIPAAMSLPDVMMVNTGRNDLDMLLPDVTKAQSFGGRVSHSYSAGNVSSCIVCNAQAAAGCRECFLERFGLKDPTPPESSKQLSEELPKGPNNSKIAEDSSEIVFGYGRIVYKNDNRKGEPSEYELLQLQDCNSYCALGEHSYNAGGPTQGGEAPHQRTCHANEASTHSMEECLKLLASGDVPAELCESHSSSGSKKKNSEFVLSPPNEPSHPLFGRSGDSRLSQHRHKPRTNRKSTASVKSNKSSGRPSSSVGGGALCSPDSIKKHAARTDSVQSSPACDHAALLDESKDYDDVFEESDETIGETSKNATTDECYLSGNPTESVYFSETVNGNVKTPDSDVVVLPNGLEVTHDPKSKACGAMTSERNNNTSASRKVDQPNRPRAQHVPEKVQGARTQFEFHLGSRTSKSHGQEQYNNNGYQRESSGSSYVHDDEGSSGIFSGDSPVANSKDIAKTKWTAKKESQSEITQEERTAGKQPARRVKSYN